MQWDPDFMAAGQMLDNMALEADEGVVEGEAIGADPNQAKELEDRITSLCGRTRDMRVMALRAELAWRQSGLAAFADTMEDAVALAERWPDPDSGFHPRADPDDGDLGERAAALGKLLNRAPRLAAVVGWGAAQPPMDARQAAAATLRGVFDQWTARLEAAFARDLPSRRDAWNAIRELLGEVVPVAAAGDEEDGAPAAVAAPVPADAWDLVARAAEVMAAQDRHSPALPILRMLLKWRSEDILGIADAQRNSGLSLEQLLDSVRNQLNPPEL